MALTTLEETQLRQLLIHFEGLGDVGAESAALLASLLAGDVIVTNLPAANPITTADVLYLAQSGADVKATAEQFGQFILAHMPSVPLADPLAAGDIVFVTQTGETRQSTVGAFADYVLTLFPNPVQKQELYYFSQI
jgi:hypothetical protein